jgi:hypothetical protein
MTPEQVRRTRAASLYETLAVSVRILDREPVTKKKEEQRAELLYAEFARR